MIMSRTSLLRATVVALCSLGVAVSPALAGGTAAPGWRIISHAVGPSNLPPGGNGFIVIHLYNSGAAPAGCTKVNFELEKAKEEREREKGVAGPPPPVCSSESPLSDTNPIALTDVLPEGVTFTGAQPMVPGGRAEPWTCTGARVVTCTTSAAIAGGDSPETVDLEVHVESGISGVLTNHVDVSGGGATAASTDPVAVSEATPRFGVQDFEVWASNAAGATDTQAGSHPYELTTAFDLNTVVGTEERERGEEGFTPAGEVENVTVNLPAGIIGDPNAVPQCPRVIFDAERCPASSQVGVDTAFVGQARFVFEVFNLVPPPGVPAQLGFELAGVRTYLDTHVRSGDDYGISEHVEHVAQKEISFNSITIWGVPSDPSHDRERCGGGLGCGQAGDDATAHTAFLTLPTSCGEPGKSGLSSGISMNSWQDETDLSSAISEYENNVGAPVGLEGCQRLSLSPTVTIAPDTEEADTPAGLSVDIKVPQEGLLDGEGLASADIQNTKVVLPQGLVINPGQAAGLEACQAGEDGLTSEAEAREGKENAGPPACPNASKVGTVTIHSPLIESAAEKQFEGDVYVLQSNPPELKLLVAASADGVNVKLVGTVHLNEQTGRLETTFKGTPQLPFTDFKLSFSGGAQAALDTPAICGTYGSNADFTPWSAPLSPDAFSEDSFAIDAPAAGASSCTGPLPFGPSLTAGATTDQAGGFTDFSLLLQRGDDQQRVSSLSFKTPLGLLGMISKVPLCDEADANAGTCPASSQIGHTVVAAGPGPYPLVVPQPGQSPAPIYLTGGYEGAPYGLSIVVPLHVGPFVLQTQVVRARIEVDPHTAQLTVTTDPLPQIIDGIPTDLRSIDAVIDREGFMFNPTNCDASSFSGTAWGTPPPGAGGAGASAPISSHFQVGSCQSLKFAPDFKVSTLGRTSKAEGASLTAKIVYPATPPGNNQASSQANIASVKVDLPKQLPSRLTTLQKACVAKVFEANPAACPKESVVGHATAVTPVLPVSLNGPAYFVSHGGEAFPSLIVVLQGYGVTVDLVGATFISKAGITSSTFKTVPDVPVSSFELTLPEGRFSALAANLPASAKGSFCGQKLAMPTAFVGQNGAEIHESTAIGVTGCTKAKALTRAQKLAVALKVCHKKAKGKRAACEKTARKKYPPAKRKKAK
jgi:hypothetical protein